MQYADVLNGTSFPRMVRVACPRQKTKRRRLTATPVLLRVVRVGGQGLCSGLDYDYYTTTSIRQSDGCTVFARDALQLFDDISILCLCFCNILPLQAVLARKSGDALLLLFGGSIRAVRC